MFIYGRKSINGIVEWLGVPALIAVLGLLGLKIYRFPIRVGGTDVATNVELWQLALDLVLEEEASLGVARSLSVPITFAVVRKMRTQGCTVSVTFACGRESS